MPAPSGEFEPWEKIQMKTFTKWCNNHLGKRWGNDAQIENILTDWESGIKLMKLAVALYEQNDKNPAFAISMPKLKPAEEVPKNRIQMVNNGAKAFELLKSADCKLRGVSGENLVDHDKVQILGMIWMLILDYAARGFGGSSAEVKRALLEWVNKNTKDYERVNPPGVKNFTTDWRSGLAWCALIDKHRPGVIDYQACLGKTNAQNLETAFAAAEKHWNIPRLLDVEDVDNEAPDEKSVMTYVMEYFLAMAGDGLKDAAAAQAAEWLKFLRELRNRMNEYERRARLLLGWSDEQVEKFNKYNFGDTKDQAQKAFTQLRDFVGTQKPVQECEKMDLEALYAEIQTQLLVNNLAAYKPPEGLSPEDIESSFWTLGKAQSTHGKKVRENKFRFIEKKEDVTSEETVKQIRESFNHYDANKNGVLNKVEFNAACMEMGVALKSQEEKDELFNKVGGGGEVKFEQYAKWMESRVKVTMDNKESAKAAFKAIADGGAFISENQLKTNPLTDDDRAYLMANMDKKDGQFDYNGFIDKIMLGGSGMTSGGGSGGGDK